MIPQEWRDLLALLPGYDSEATADPTDYFDPDAAQLALHFFEECLQFIEGDRAGEPFILEFWQAAVVAALWGWRREDGSRRYRECFLYVPRKNGKTPLAAGLLLLSAYCDGEPGAQLYAAAASREQASLIFRHAAGMVAREPALASRAKVYKSFKSIEFPGTDSIFRALASDADNLHGLNSQTVVVDELHAHPNGELVNVLVTSTASRTSPLVLYITTADFNRESICNEKHDFASKVRDEVLQDRAFLPVIYEAGPDEDWTSPEVWARANPNLGVSISLEYLERECQRAKTQASYEGTFRRLHLNQRTSVETRWIRGEDWKECAEEEFPDLSGRGCYGGLDLSTTTDLSSLCLIFPPRTDSEPYRVLPFFFIPEAKLQDRADRVPYAAWHRAGSLYATPGDVVDYRFIREKITELGRTYSIQEIRFDPYNATHLCTQLAEEDGFAMTQHRNGMLSMSPPTKEFERLVLSRGLAHPNHPVLNWNVANVACVTDASGNIRPAKDKATGRIDGTVAAIMALAGALAGTGGSVYEERGFLFL